MANPSSSVNSIGEFLTERGWISGVELHYARQSQRQLGGRLETCLLSQGALEEDQLLEALSEFHALPTASADDLRRASEEARTSVSEEVVRRLRAIPFGIVGDELWVAVDNADDGASQRELAAASDLPVRLHVAVEPRVAQALETFYGVSCSEEQRRLLSQLDQTESQVDLQRPVRPQPPSVAPSPRRAPPRPGTASGPSPGALSAFERRLTHLNGTREILAALVEYLARDFERVVVFRSRKEGVSGWMGVGAGISETRLRAWQLDYSEPSAFLNLRNGASFLLGSLAEMDGHRSLREVLGNRLPEEVLLLPMVVRDRLIAFLYCDRGDAGLAGIDLGEAQRTVAATAASLDQHLRRRKLRKT